jgi:O-antigen/teichoic acid export membrane protein
MKFWQRMSQQGGFVRSVSILVGGTAFAHAITALALPILTRLYSPSDFGVLAVFTALLSIISVVACMRFEVAIPIPKQGAVALNLLILSFISTILISIFLITIVLSSPSLIANLLKHPEITPYLVLLPVGILFSGAYGALQNWYVREKQFSLIARSRVLQSAACASTQIGTVGMAIAPLGLLLGYLLNTGSACLNLGYKLYKELKLSQQLKTVSWDSLKETAKEFSRYPKYSTWEALANSAAIQIPILMIATLATGAEAGYLLLAMSVVQAPMALFGTAIGQVYLSHASDEYREGRLGVFTASILGGLIKVGLGPLLMVGSLSPFVFGPVFGQGWDRAGWLVAWMTPWFIMQFLVSPISMALHITGQQRTLFCLQVVGLVFRVLVVWMAGKLLNQSITEAYAISGFLFYSIYLWLVIRCVKLSWVMIFENVKNGILITGFWLVFSALFLFLIKLILKI